MESRRVWMIARELLTEQQDRVVRLSVEQNQFISGPPGCGKTVLLLHRANHLLHECDLSPRQMRVLVFTNVLRAYIQAGGDALNLPFETVQSFYSWVFPLADREGLPRSQDVRLEEKCKDTLERVTQYFETEHVPPVLDAVIVDEGQDLPLAAYRLLRKASRHVTVFADSVQNLYAEAGAMAGAGRILDIGDRAILLSDNLRSNIGVARLAAQFLPGAQRNDYLQSCDRGPVSERTRVPLLFRARSEEEEWEQVGETVKQEVAANNRIAILLADNAGVNRAHAALAGSGLPVEKVTARAPGEADFNTLTPKILTVFSAKGLSFDTVLIPRITRQHYAHAATPAERMLFVACTRARDWVCLSTVQGSEIRELRQLEGLILAGHLIEQQTSRRNPSFEQDDLPEQDAPF
jgi:superfamily I DNA/RNA helicase